MRLATTYIKMYAWCYRFDAVWFWFHGIIMVKYQHFSSNNTTICVLQKYRVNVLFLGLAQIHLMEFLGMISKLDVLTRE
jgi:hypothetical protein